MEDFSKHVFEFEGSKYHLTDLPVDQAHLLNAISIANEKIVNYTSEITLLQAGKEKISDTLRKICQTLTPVKVPNQ